MRVVAVDPDARGFAWAIYVDDVLVRAGRGRTRAALKGTAPTKGDRWLLEAPQNYERFGVAHRDLDRLRAVLKAVEREVRAAGGTARRIRPAAWKGNVPKAVHHARTKAALAPEEVAVAYPKGVYDHNVLDAVALGLFAVGRARRGGV